MYGVRSQLRVDGGGEDDVTHGNERPTDHQLTAPTRGGEFVATYLPPRRAAGTALQQQVTGHSFFTPPEQPNPFATFGPSSGVTSYWLDPHQAALAAGYQGPSGIENRVAKMETFGSLPHELAPPYQPPNEVAGHVGQTSFPYGASLPTDDLAERFWQMGTADGNAAAPAHQGMAGQAYLARCQNTGFGYGEQNGVLGLTPLSGDDLQGWSSLTDGSEIGAQQTAVGAYGHPAVPPFPVMTAYDHLQQLESAERGYGQLPHIAFGTSEPEGYRSTESSSLSALDANAMPPEELRSVHYDASTRQPAIAATRKSANRTAHYERALLEKAIAPYFNDAVLRREDYAYVHQVLRSKNMNLGQVVNPRTDAERDVFEEIQNNLRQRLSQQVGDANKAYRKRQIKKRAGEKYLIGVAQAFAAGSLGPLVTAADGQFVAREASKLKTSAARLIKGLRDRNLNDQEKKSFRIVQDLLAESMRKKFRMGTAGQTSKASSLMTGFDLHEAPVVMDGQYGAPSQWISSDLGQVASYGHPVEPADEPGAQYLVPPQDKV